MARIAGDQKVIKTKRSGDVRVDPWRVTLTNPCGCELAWILHAPQGCVTRQQIRAWVAVLAQCWASVADSGPTLSQQREGGGAMSHAP